MCTQYADSASASNFRRTTCGRRLCAAGKCRQGSGSNTPRCAVLMLAQHDEVCGVCGVQGMELHRECRFGRVWTH